MQRFLDQLRTLSPAQRYALATVGGAGLLLALGLTLWIAGGFGGGSDEAQLACSPCPTVSRTPRPTPTASPSATPACCTPTPGATFPPTEAPTEVPTAAPTPAPPPAPPPTYTLAPVLQSSAFERLVDFSVIPGTNNTEAIAVEQKAERI